MENMAVVVRKNEIVQIPVSQIKPSPFQPRAFFDRETVDELADSIRQYGVLQPICVRSLGKYSYELVFGERRLKACKEAGMFYVPCVIADICDRDSAVMSLIENIQKENINFFDEARAIFNLINDYGYTVQQIAIMLGKKEKYIFSKLKLMKLKYEFRRQIIDNGISEEQTGEIVKIFDDNVLSLVLNKVIKLGLNLRKTRELVERVLKKLYMGYSVDEWDIDDIISKIERSNGEQKIKVYIKDLKIFTNTIYQAVETMNRSGMRTFCEFDDSQGNLEIRIIVQKNFDKNT